MTNPLPSAGDSVPNWHRPGGCVAPDCRLNAIQFTYTPDEHACVFPHEVQRSHINMKSLIAGLIVFAAVFSSGCSTVTVKQPLGEKLSAAELKALEGTWVDQEGRAAEVHALSNGELAWAGVSWDENEQQFKMETARILITRSGSLMFAALPMDSDDRYVLALCKLQGKDTASFYCPAVDVFEKCVADHELEGSVKQREHDKIVNIDAAPDKVLEFITRTGVEKCFVDTSEDRLVYKRVSKP
jgi:hypothetical protein